MIRARCFATAVIGLSSCSQDQSPKVSTADSSKTTRSAEPGLENSISDPLVSQRYSADPSAHVFDGKIYVYPSHDYDAGVPVNDNGKIVIIGPYGKAAK